jgi:splicing factor 3A subunit 3
LCEQDQIKAELYDGEAEEEFEDSEGNVLNKRTYHDLARQGLL